MSINSIKEQIDKLKNEISSSEQSQYNPFQYRNMGYMNNYMEWDKMLTQKLLLIGGCLFLGGLIVYLIMNDKCKR